jgi:hypothetical protein
LHEDSWIIFIDGTVNGAVDSAVGSAVGSTGVNANVRAAVSVTALGKKIAVGAPFAPTAI